MGKKNKLSKSSLHWFIRSRPYVLLAELRRRFDLDGTEEVWAIQTPEGKTYVGLPERAARLLEELVRERRVGVDYVVDLHARLAIGVYAYDLLKTPLAPFPMRPGAPRFNGATPNGQDDPTVLETPEGGQTTARRGPGSANGPSRPRPWAARPSPGGQPRGPEARLGERRPDAPRRGERPDRSSADEPGRPEPVGQERRRRRRGGKRGSDRPETRSGKQP
ncbi:MAG TPA: hypothetical protein VG370_03245 [Chloroflexota bacterium]|nr:hypothetical protein [Chloroflexota bacterium]